MINSDFQALLAKVKAGHGDSDRHHLTLFSLVVSMKARKILELGVRDGGTTIPFILGAVETGGKVHSVDIEPSSFIPSGGYEKYWKFTQRDAISFLKNSVKKKNIWDIIYVDDWHAGDHVTRELALIEKLVTPSSLIILHDLMYGNAEPHYRSEYNNIDPQWAQGGPYRAVVDLDPEVWEWATIPINNGLTILRKISRERVQCDILY